VNTVASEKTAHTIDLQSRIPTSRYFIFFALAIVGGLLDLSTKHYAFEALGSPAMRNEPYWLIEGYFGFETAVNRGALFGMGAGFGKLFAGLSLVAAVGIGVWLFYFRAACSLWLTIAMGCVLAGIIGNLYDRLGLAADPDLPIEYANGVRDWILIRYQNFTWPNFNIADSFLVAGAIMLGWYSFFGPGEPTPDGQ
jgi:signal peptidase II